MNRHPNPIIRTGGRLALLAMIAGLSFTLHADPMGGMNGDSGSGPIRKKLIERGWDAPTVKEYVENVKEIEASPFDGVAIKFDTVDDAGKPIQAFMGGVNVPWKKEWFQASVDALKKTKSPKLADSFFSTSMATGPHNFADAFDDEGWKNIINHYRIAAWAAKQAGLKGVMLDLEAYSSTIIKFAAAKEDKSFDEYAAQVRKRGREMMQAMAEEYPDMTLFTLFLNSGAAMAALGGDPRETLESGKSHYNLMPALINGWLDAIPPTMTVVDGMEHSYPHSTELAYLRRVNAARNTVLATVDEKNRAKYRAQVQAGLAIYLDAFLVDQTDAHSTVYTIPPLEGTLTDRLRQATIDAFEAVDEYVWVFDERYRFWPTVNTRVLPHYWDQIMPGTTKALNEAKEVANRRLAIATREFGISESTAKLRGVPLKNLLKDPNVIPVPKPKKGEPVVAVEEAWIPQNSSGTLERSIIGNVDAGSLLLKGTKDGTWAQIVDVKPSSFYKLRVGARQQNKGESQVKIVWLDVDGKELGSANASAEKSPKDAWVSFEALSLAPTNAVKAAIQLSAKNQTSDDDQIWFDNVELYRVGVN